MASKIPPQLLNVGKTLYTWSIRVSKFFKHRLLTKRKNILIIGQDDTPLYLSLQPKLVKTWQITNLLCQQPAKQPQLLSQGQSSTQIKQDETSNVKQTKNQVVSSDKQAKAEAASKSKEKEYYKRLYIWNNNYNEIEKKLQGRQFDSIVVLPQPDSQHKCFNIEDEAFVTEYPTIQQQLLMRNLFAYRLASKYLTSSGVIILSASDRDFIKQSLVKEQNNVISHEESRERKWWDSNQIIDAQISYLGVVIGDRDYTDLNSWVVVALSKQAATQNPEFVADYYRLWADSQSLPMPGSFALFRVAKQNYVEYL